MQGGVIFVTLGQVSRTDHVSCVRCAYSDRYVWDQRRRTGHALSKRTSIDVSRSEVEVSTVRGRDPIAVDRRISSGCVLAARDRQ